MTVLYVGVGYWMISNKQIFSNLVFPLKNQGDVIKTGHNINNIALDHSFPLLIFNVACILVIILIALRYIKDNFVFSSSQQEELLGVEELLDFH